MDYLTIKNPKSDRDVNVLVMTDHFTCYVQAIVTSSQTAKVTTQALWDHFIVHYGSESLISDHGRNSESELIKELCQLAQVQKLRTTPYHSETNGQCECLNLTLIQMTGTLSEKDRSHWNDFVPTLLHAYNCTKSNATEFSLYYLMLGRKPRLP